MFVMMGFLLSFCLYGCTKQMGFDIDIALSQTEINNLSQNLHNELSPYRVHVFWSVFIFIITQLIGVLLWCEKRYVAISLLLVSLSSLSAAVYFRSVIYRDRLLLNPFDHGVLEDSMRLILVLVIISILNYRLAKYIATTYKNKEQALLNSISNLTALNKIKAAYTQDLEYEVNQHTEMLKIKTEQLQCQTKKLKTLDAAKSRFFACISHEFRTPITLIQGPLLEIMNKYGDELNTYCQAQVKMALRNTKRLGLLVEQILDLSKLEAGHLKISPKTIEGCHWLKAIVANFESPANQKHIQLTCHTPETLWLAIDETQFEKVVLNLLSNALKYTPENGKILVALVEREQQAVLTIKDSGVGMSAEAVQHCFDMFYQSSDKNVAPGSGIGLTLVKEITELHGGRINVSSTLGVGSTFVVKLPLPVQTVSETKLRLPPVKNGLSNIADNINGPTTMLTIPKLKAHRIDDKAKLLVVEDNMDMLQFLCDGLSQHYRLDLVCNGKEAIDAMHKSRPDIVLTDWMMPEMDGISLLQYIREHDTLYTLPVIILTGSACDESKKQGYAALADDFLTKPFNLDDLRQRLDVILKIRHLIAKLSSDQSIPQPSVVSIQASDFLAKINAVIDEHMSNVNFDCEMLSTAVFMTPKTVSRKLEKITGLTPGLYIRQRRLYKAKTLLQEGVYTTKKELALAVGFKSISYFNKLLKTEFPELQNAE